MDRRDFLGSAIGTILAAQVPFFALLESAEWQQVILPYRMMFVANGCTIQAPGIERVVISEDSRKFSFVASMFEANVDMTITRTILLTEQGMVICEFPKVFCLLKRDSLSLTVNLVADRPCTVEELVELGVRRN